MDGASVQREKGMIRCQVTLLDDRVFTCDVDVSCIHLDTHTLVSVGNGKRNKWLVMQNSWKT